MSSSVTSCFKCQIDFGCEITLKFHQLMFHFESDDNLKSHVYLNPLLKKTSYRDVGKQVPFSELNPCKESQNEIDDFDRTTFDEVPSTEADCELESCMGLDPQLTIHQDIQEDLGEKILTTEPYLCEESQNEIDDFDWTTFNEVPSTEADCELDSYIDFDLSLIEHQDVQEYLGEKMLTTEPYPCEESQNEIDDFDWTTFNEVPSTEADCELESYMALDPQLTIHQDVQEDVGEQILTTESYPCEELQNEIDDFDWTTFNEVLNAETDSQFESYMGLDPQLTINQDVQEDLGEQILGTTLNHCKESQTKSDDFHQTSFIKDPRTEVSCDQEQNKHHKTVQKKFHKDKKEHKCNVCQKTFKQQGYLKIHIKTVHDNEKDYECNVCQKKFTHQNSLIRHQKSVHQGRKDYECDVCQKRFSRKSIMTRHKQIVHDKSKDFECDECHKVFSVPGNLKQHKNAVHEGQKDYVCDLCQKTFSLQRNLKRHIKTVHDKQRDYECGLCQKTFSLQENLKKHIKTVHDKQKDYECDKCHKVFSEQGNLKQHKNAVHEGQKDYVCDLCQKTFSLQENLKKHIKTVHDKQKDYDCDKCHKVFSEQGYLKQHKNEVHEGQKDFECDLCQKTFALKGNLKRHIKTVHDK